MFEKDNNGFGHIKTEEQLAALPILSGWFGEHIEMCDGKKVRIPVMRDDILAAYVEPDDILEGHIGDELWRPVLTRTGWQREKVSHV